MANVILPAMPPNLYDIIGARMNAPAKSTKWKYAFRFVMLELKFVPQIVYHI